MILPSSKSPSPPIQVHMPPAIHIHASEVNPTFNVQPSEIRQTIEVRPADVNPTINVASQEPTIVIQRESRTWKFEVRDPSGNVTKTITATPI